MDALAALINFAKRSIPTAGLLVLAWVLHAQAAIVAEGVYTISAPEQRAFPFACFSPPPARGSHQAGARR